MLYSSNTCAVKLKEKCFLLVRVYLHNSCLKYMDSFSCEQCNICET